MSFRVTIQPGSRQFVAEAGETLLDAGLRQGIVLPHACRDGACGACKGRLLSGSVAYARSDLLGLSAADRAAGLALLCCAEATSDLVVESRQAAADDFPLQTLPARVEKLEFAAPDVALLSLRLPASENFRFHAGQYIDILLKDGRRRSFSLANAPSAGGFLELHVRHVPGGAFTEQVFSTLKARDLLRFEGPRGSFRLRQDSSRPAILLAGGTGFAPIKALVEEALSTGDPRPLHVYWGVRTRADLYLPELPARWLAENPRLRYTPVLSAPQPEDAWTGRQGLVHAAVLADHADLSAFEVYACGSPAMIAAARADFAAAGLPEENFFADVFSFAAR